MNASLQSIGLARKLVYAVVGVVSYPFLAWVNRLSFSGAEHVRGLPPGGVLFVSNHQTYFADVIAMLHVLGAVRRRRTAGLGFPWYLLNPLTRVNYVASEQTMKATWLSRVFALAGAITVKRAWNAEAKETLRGLETCDSREIMRALAGNWVITFPQGTTTPQAPGRKGTALIIKLCRPVVIPVVIGGFGEAFGKKGLSLRKAGVVLTMRFKAPLAIDYEGSTAAILAQVMAAIEQDGKAGPQAAIPAAAVSVV